VNAIAYSVAPEQVVEEMDRVLVPGGLIKATFQDKEHFQCSSENVFA